MKQTRFRKFPKVISLAGVKERGLIFLIFVTFFGACSPVGNKAESESPEKSKPEDSLSNAKVPESEIAPAAATAPTPHPATGATQAAIQLFPELAKKDSMFNRAFRDLYEERRKTDPQSLTKADWPLVLAKQTDTMLGISEKFPASPSVAAAAASPTWIEQRKNQPSALDMPAYDQRRAVRSRYYYNDQNERYRIDRYGRRVYD